MGVERQAALALLLLLLSGPAWSADWYECVDADGKKFRTKADFYPEGGYGCVTIQPPPKPPPPPKPKRAEDVGSLSFTDACVELGHQLRATGKQRNEKYYEALLAQASKFYSVTPVDHETIRRRQLRIGMSSCSVLASLGKPNRANRTVVAAGERHQWVYSDRRLYAYLEGRYAATAVLTSWQD